MLHLKTDHTFRNRFLFVFLFLTILSGLTASADNRAGEVILRTQGNLAANAGALNNEAGYRSQDNLTANAGALNNEPGYRSQDNLTANAGALNNEPGSRSQANLVANAGALNNEVGYRSQDNLTANAGALNNEPGSRSQGNLAATGSRSNEASFRAQTGNRHHNASFRPQASHRPHFDLNKPANFFVHLPLSLMEDVPEDLTEDQVNLLFRATEPRHKRRFYISVASQQYSFTTRLQQLQLLLEQYVPEDEDKTGIYQWHDAFLPAYYKFLFRYTLF